MSPCRRLGSSESFREGRYSSSELQRWKGYTAQGWYEKHTMSAIVIVIIAIAATGVLMMRFCKRWLARINIAFTNRITGLFAGWLPGFGILTHVGRKSGKVYRTPIN